MYILLFYKFSFFNFLKNKYFPKLLIISYYLYAYNLNAFLTV